MTISKKGKFWFGTEQLDIRQEIDRYSKMNGYPAKHFADCECICGGRVFRLNVDDDEGVAERICVNCSTVKLICDNEMYASEAELQECGCPCEYEGFEISVGVALYENSSDVRWIYLGCRCPACGLTACYADWKCEGGTYEVLLESV